jgi:hypothetical protein
MIDSNGPHVEIGHVTFFPHFEGATDKYRTPGIRQREKIRIDLVVEQVRSQAVQNLGGAGEPHRLRDTQHVIDKIVGQRRQTLDVVKVEMGEQHMADLLLFFESKRRSDRPRIDHHRLIDQKPAGPALMGLAASFHELIGSMAPEHTNLHRPLS